jgi:hypothetical protein
MRVRNRHGGLLIQVLVVMAILGCVLPSLLDLLGAGDRDLVSSAGQQRALSAAQSLLEQASSNAYLMAHIQTTVNVPDELESLSLAEEFRKHDHGKATVTVAVTPRQTNPLSKDDETDLLDLTVDVHWEEAQQSRNLRLMTRRALWKDVQ